MNSETRAAIENFQLAIYRLINAFKDEGKIGEALALRDYLDDFVEGEDLGICLNCAEIRDIKEIQFGDGLCSECHDKAMSLYINDQEIHRNWLMNKK